MSTSQTVLDMICNATASALKKELSAHEQKSIYLSAQAFYEMGNYIKASELFLRLTMADPYEQAFWRGLASAYQMQQMWQSALEAWALCSLLDAKDPFAHFHAAECLISNGQYNEARQALDCARGLCLENENHTTLLAKIASMQEAQASMES